MGRIGSWEKKKAVPIAAGLALGGVATGVAAAVAFGALPPEGIGPNGARAVLRFADGIAAYGSWMTSFNSTLATKALFGPPWSTIAPVFDGYHITAGIALRAKMATAIGVAGGLSTFMGLMPYQEEYRIGMRHIRGRIVRKHWHAVTAARRAFAQDMRRKGNGPGLYLVPGVQMDRARETEGFFVIGSPGSGKTVWFRFLIDQILARGDHAMSQIRAGVPLAKLAVLPDKIISVDVKGDSTEAWPNNDFMLFAPHDTGMRDGPGGPDDVPQRIGYAWDIGKDIQGAPAARDFAARVVKATDEPVWGDAARGILKGMIRGLQQEYGTAWGWKEFLDVVSLEARELRAYLDRWDPIEAKFVTVTKAGPTRTASSYLANITTGVVPMVEALAAAWGDYPPEARISLNDWLLDPLPERRTIILQRSGRVREISSSWIRAVLFQLASYATSPDLENDDRRRVWFICDEAPQYLSKDDGFLEISEVGRQKGFCNVVAAQVNKQFEKVWSAAEMETLEAMMRTKMIFRTGSGAVSDYLAEKIVGSSDWERTDISRSFGQGRTRNVGYKPERELVVMPNWFEEELGARWLGVKVCYVGPKDVCVLTVPYPKWKKRRKATVVAEWVRSNSFRVRRGGGQDAPSVLPPPGVARGIPPVPMPQGEGRGLFSIGVLAGMSGITGPLAVRSPQSVSGDNEGEDDGDDD